MENALNRSIQVSVLSLTTKKKKWKNHVTYLRNERQELIGLFKTLALS
jgi:hypothetical protein